MTVNIFMQRIDQRDIIANVVHSFIIRNPYQQYMVDYVLHLQNYLSAINNEYDLSYRNDTR